MDAIATAARSINAAAHQIARLFLVSPKSRVWCALRPWTPPEGMEFAADTGESSAGFSELRITWFYRLGDRPARTGEVADLPDVGNRTRLRRSRPQPVAPLLEKI